MTILEPFVPSEPLKLQVEVKDEKRIREVDVGKSAVVPRSQIHRQVEVVERVEVRLLYHLEQVLLRKSHRNILDHHSGQGLDPVQNGMEIDGVIG